MLADIKSQYYLWAGINIVFYERAEQRSVLGEPFILSCLVSFNCFKFTQGPSLLLVDISRKFQEASKIGHQF